MLQENKLGKQKHFSLVCLSRLPSVTKVKKFYNTDIYNQSYKTYVLGK
jgi:hypothetical protein